MLEPYNNGLYHLELDKLMSNSKPINLFTNYCLLQTVKENQSYFEAQEIKGVDMSRELQQDLHYSSTTTLETYVNYILIKNCTITADDVNRAEIMCGPAVPFAQGHMTRKRPPIHGKIEKVPLPPMIAQHHRTVALSIYFFFVNGNIFFHAKSDKINFLTAQYCTSRSLKTIMTALEGVTNKCNGRSFNISDFHGDNDFDKTVLKDFL